MRGDVHNAILKCITDFMSAQIPNPYPGSNPGEHGDLARGKIDGSCDV